MMTLPQLEMAHEGSYNNGPRRPGRDERGIVKLSEVGAGANHVSLMRHI
jgi:hypothetical protein